ncbi:hypothetical protein RKE29_13915 [Streptomyces sp. B1866]|uniref:plasmid mobilization protein n=1 Tax=Streptomyces sp. B1866 TaxID=3075431 RepID=UPI00288FFB10|nr:hypothetical protein [Streptomyces sp. B1866]MDT3397729.1 hypothetical protein [Streptomyces sp. B1866]
MRASAAAAAHRKPKRRQRDAVLKKQDRVTVRFDPDEKQQLRAQARAAGLSLAHLIARRALAGDGTAPAGVLALIQRMDAAIDELAATRTELGAWGNNLNQVTRQLNMSAPLPVGPAAAFVRAADRILPRVGELVEQVDDAAHHLATQRARG